MNHQTALAPTASPRFEWRAPLGPWRWLILGTLGVAPSSGGGRTVGADPDRDDADLEGQAGDRTSSPPRADHSIAEAPNGSRATSFCIVGRPFLIDGAVCLAASAARHDWYPSERTAVAPAVEAGEASSAAIARGWTEQALMEHASVAAFARFALQLLQLGAPAELVERASAAMQDEIRHARACFDLARRHSTQDVGPGPLAVEGALDRMDPASIVLDALREGCIGETVAAIQAAEALSHCEDPAARAVLERIAEEEGKHAELAWRFVAWAIETRPELFERVQDAFARELTGVRSGGARGLRDASPADRELARHGLLSAPLRAALRQRVLANVIAPCSEALLDGAGWQRPDSRRVVRRTPHAA